MADPRAAFRLGLAPVLLLAWNMALGDPIPFLAPCLLVTILAAAPGRPKLRTLAGMLVLVVALAWTLDALFGAVSDSPAALWLALLALAVAAFARLARKPGDMVAMLALMSASIVFVIRQWAQGAGLGVPSLMGHAVLQAALVALLAHAVLRSPAAHAASPPMRLATGAGALPVLVRSVALVALLGFALLLRDNSAILVALTAVTILAAPAETVARRQGHALVLANAVAAAMLLPLLAVAAIRPDPSVLVPLAMAGGLWMARGISGGGTGRIIAQSGLPVFVVLLGLLLPKAGDTALALLLDRLLTLGLVMLCALAVLLLLPAARAGSGRWRGE